MGNCAKGGGASDAASQRKWSEAEARAKAEEEADLEAGKAGATPAKPPVAVVVEPSGSIFEEEEAAAALPMDLESLLEALAASLRVDANQLKTIRRFWQAVGLEDDFPKEPLEITLDGDGSALELAIKVAPMHCLRMLPLFLELAPEARPSPPGARAEASARPPRQLQEEETHFAAMPPEESLVPVTCELVLPVEAPARPSRQLQPDMLLGMAPENGPLPTVVSVAQRPKGKAKAKSKVVRDADRGVAAAPFVVPEFSPVPRTEAAAPTAESQNSPIAAMRDPGPKMDVKAEPVISTQVQEKAEPAPSDPPKVTLAAERERAKERERERAQLEASENAQAQAAERAQAQVREKEQAEARAKAQAAASKKHVAQELAQVPEDEEVPGVAPMSDMPGMDPIVAAAQWRETLERAIEALASRHVVLWLRLGGLGLPRGVARNVDVGVRLPAAASIENSFQIIHPYQDVYETFAGLGITEEAGWVVAEMGCSFFMHGPMVMFTVVQADSQVKLRCDPILQKVVPESLGKAVQTLAYGSGIETSIRGGLKDGDMLLGAHFALNEQLPGKSSKKDLQSMAVDLALGREKVFDAFMVERTRQMFASMGGHTVVSAIECRANDTARVTLRVTPGEGGDGCEV